MLASQAHSFTQQARLAITLAWVAGYTNVVTLLACGTVTSHVTGTGTNLGRHLLEAHWALAGFMFLILASFFLGAAFAAFMTEYGRRRAWRSIYIAPVTIELLLLITFGVGVWFHAHAPLSSGAIGSLVGIAAFAMGLQNATITRISGGVVRTTHLTGPMTDFGSESAQLLIWLRDRHKNVPPETSRDIVRSMRTHPTARRVALLGCVIVSFIAGGGMGTLAYDNVPAWTMAPPLAFLLWLVLMEVRTPVCDTALSDEFTPFDDGTPTIPETLAVYHLRRPPRKRFIMQKEAHRVPDLVRWIDRLPAKYRAVILDLGEVSVLDATAAFELRAALLMAQQRKRTLIIAGMSGEQYNALRSLGAGDALDPSNVCPDLELAVARGLAIVDDDPRT